MPQFAFPCLKLKQRDTSVSPTAILFAAPASEVLQWAAIQRRSQTPQGTQRKLSKAKVNAIKRFFLGDDRNTIPAAVVVTLNVLPDAFTGVAITLSNEHMMKNGAKILRLDIPDGAGDDVKPGIVLDGQHRLLGMRQYSPTCMVNVVALLNVDDMEKAFQFPSSTTRQQRSRATLSVRWDLTTKSTSFPND
jgi:DGQHR domain-containing protein